MTDTKRQLVLAAEDLIHPTMERARVVDFQKLHVAALMYAADQLEGTGEAGTTNAALLLRQLADLDPDAT